VKSVYAKCPIARKNCLTEGGHPSRLLVQFTISDFGFEVQDSFDFKILPGSGALSVKYIDALCQGENALSPLQRGTAAQAAGGRSHTLLGIPDSILIEKAAEYPLGLWPQAAT
jgi:hypothetical protein